MLGCVFENKSQNFFGAVELFSCELCFAMFRYITSMYWSVVTLSSVEAGLSPVNRTEKLFGCFIAVIGLMEKEAGKGTGRQGGREGGLETRRDEKEIKEREALGTGKQQITNNEK